MNLRTVLILFLSTLLFVDPACAQMVRVGDFPTRRADTILFERNWRTKDKILMAEMEFAQGDSVNSKNLELSLKKIWNLQNFALVDYRWDSLPGGRWSLVLIARDALTIVPIFGGNFQTDDVRITAGLADRNLLGRNIRLELRAQIGITEPSFGEVKLGIPRQLLWRNMALEAGARSQRAFWQLNENQYYIKITNPYHQDYQNRFSPDLEIGLRQFRPIPMSGHQLAELGPREIPDFNHSFGYFRLSESLGTITHRRHQEEGFIVTGMLGAGVGLAGGSAGYVEGSILVEYDRLLSRKLQLGMTWEGHYNSSPSKYLWTRYGPRNIRGIEYGDLSGPLMQLATVGLYYTWINRDFLALEQSAFVQFASASGDPADLAGFKPHYAIGTGFLFTIPMYPAAGLLISFSYSPNRNNWFYLEL